MGQIDESLQELQTAYGKQQLVFWVLLLIRWIHGERVFHAECRRDVSRKPITGFVSDEKWKENQLIARWNYYMQNYSRIPNLKLSEYTAVFLIKN
jgi:hypothetical protein